MKTISGNTTRPTADRVKESLFNIISPYIPGAIVLDLFAGTGNLGIEALSRGAKFAAFIDKSRECYNIIVENLIHTKLKDNAKVFTSEINNSLFDTLKKLGKFDIIFMDPPYNKNLIQETLNFVIKNDIINEDGIIIAERDVDDILPENAGSFSLVRSQKYGDTVLSFYMNNEKTVF